MPTPQNTTLDVLLLAAQSKLIADDVFHLSSCFLTVTPDLLEFPANDVFGTISPGRQTIDDPIRIGAGRVVIVVNGEMIVTIWTRSYLDQVPQDTLFLTNSATGAIQTSTAVINSLELYQPVDGSGNQLLPAGFELVEIESFSRKAEKVGWGAIKTRWKFFYTLNIANAPTS